MSTQPLRTHKLNQKNCYKSTFVEAISSVGGRLGDAEEIWRTLSYNSKVPQPSLVFVTWGRLWNLVDGERGMMFNSKQWGLLISAVNEITKAATDIGDEDEQDA